MIKIISIEGADYSRAFQTMRQNMSAYHQEHGLSWDQDWIEKHYRTKENYSVFSSDRWIGFLSLEWREADLFVHTLQLSRAAQGGVYGARVYGWILQQMEEKEKTHLFCRTFRGAPMIDLYKRLGFTLCKEEGILVTLKKSITR